MEKEMNKLVENGTYVAVDDEGQPTMNLTWAFRSKTNPDGSLSSRKSRCCVQGFSQEYLTNYQETFSSTPYWAEIALCFAYAAQKGYTMYATSRARSR